MPKVSVVIVCMNRPDLLYPCLEGIRAHTCELRGFSENNNLALKQIDSEFCFIVNDDTLMSMPVIDRLVDDFGRLPADAAVVSPKIVFPDGRVQTNGRAPWTAWRYVKHYLHRVDETVPTAWSMKDGLFRTWTVNGACFLIKTAVFREAGWFDETYTFTPEDIALGHKVNDMGHTVWADADVTITHLAGGTVSRLEAAIKPTRVRGALQFYSGGKPVKYFLLGSFVWCVEALRRLKYLFADRTDPSSHAAIMYATAKNVMRSVFTKRTSKEIFTELYREVTA